MDQLVLTREQLDKVGDHDPTKEVNTGADLAVWNQSEAKAIVTGFIQALNESVKEKTEAPVTKVCNSIIELLEELSSEIDRIELDKTPQRFGNTAFRKWIKNMETIADTRIPSMFGDKLLLKREALYYLKNSFGSGGRIDFGTGHELSFVLFFLVLFRNGSLVDERDLATFVIHVFRKYIDVAAKLQKKFNLEPAGSKGVWGLDDHFHLVYYFGSGQLINNQEGIKPKDMLQGQKTSELASKYLFFKAVDHVRTLKSGPFNEHSPILNTIATQVESWSKVNSGLWKMYQDEVIGKIAVVQHIYFGATLPWGH